MATSWARPEGKAAWAAAVMAAARLTAEEMHTQAGMAAVVTAERVMVVETMGRRFRRR